ncbi:MAG: Hsp20/alpha crystallin family protein [Desulfuromonadales bacterium]|nr:Hsp20/alpha crystallin family protein [Desulfuromonadales bacterium]
MAMWDLFREMENLRREIDNVFLGANRGPVYGRQPAFLPGLGTGIYPQVNLSDDPENLYVEALVPGMDPASLELTVMRGTLTLSGERRNGAGKDATWHRNERGIGKFLRTIELPVEVKADQVRAECRDGVLTVTLPKSEAVRPRKIEVSAH